MGYLRFVAIFVIGLVALSACGSASPPAGTAAKLRIGLLPILDSLPMYVAESEGFFAEQKLDVELTVFASALERDSAFQAGQIDGELNDLVSTGLINKDGERAKAVRVSLKPNPKMAMISIVAAPESKVKTPSDLKGVPIAVSGNTVIEYTTDRLLRSAGLSAADIKTTEVTKIPVRVEMLVKGQIEAAALPEPFAMLSLQQGARLVVDDRKAGVSQSVITFRQGVIEKNADAVRRFLVAYERAVQVLSEKADAYRDLLVDRAKVPEPLRTSMAMPEYPRAEAPSREDVEGVIDWMVEKGLLAERLPYERMVSGELLPR